MSYILDALRRADAERERGSVPGLHTLSLAAEVPSPAPPAPYRRWPWIGVGLAVGLIAALAATVALRPRPAQPQGVAVEPASVSTATTVLPAAQPVELSRVAAPPAPVPAVERSGAIKEGTDKPARILTREQLPESLRSQLPTLAVGGSMYSTNPAHRSLVLDGQLYREGEQIAPELTLERIGLKSAVFRFRGVWFEISF
ncbi:MAG: general secretion pathway protein GspB [Sutterellaceae bacterium]|nr:general secretion pathway protein GspB [Burkholderiaceae bacterium]MCX7901711.1 general secretion pathway protein GspB [Burkholderiaceae bacterium]MDW8429960.1 general secretion pathway protein GspB [Sutterellaceae bacterium]